MTWVHLVPLVHSLGFVLGGVLYVMLGVMTWRARAPHRDGGTRLALATAALGLVWNAGALVLYGVRDLGLGEPSPAVVALAFSALGFLPGVVVHASLGPARPRAATRIAVAAYALSTAAAVLHTRAAWTGAPVPSRLGLLFLTVGFGVTTLAFGLLAIRRPHGGRALPAVALAAFAVMALHLSYHGGTSDARLLDLLAHHASAPLAIVILYEDYRFALADLFLKRALGVTALVAAAGGLYLGVVAPLAGDGDVTAPVQVSLILGLWVATALVYPSARRAIDRFVDRIVLGRLDYHQLRAALAARLADARDPDDALSATTWAVTEAFAARTVSCHPVDVSTRNTDLRAASVSWPAGGVQVHVPTAESPAYRIEAGGLPPGRRLLSDDLALLETIGFMTARRIDGLRVDRERYERAIREREAQQLAAEAELRALRAQLNPHFLFNALTTLGHLMRAAPDRAVDTLYRLTALLRSVLRGTDRERTTLGEELEIVAAYLAIEQARFEERLAVEIVAAPELRNVPVAPLLLQPLVENAIKHGIAPAASGGRVCITARLQRDGEAPELHLHVRDTGQGATPAELSHGRRHGVGLANLQRRLALHYGPAARFELRSRPGHGTVAGLVLPLETEAAR